MFRKKKKPDEGEVQDNEVQASEQAQEQETVSDGAATPADETVISAEVPPVETEDGPLNEGATVVPPEELTQPQYEWREDRLNAIRKDIEAAGFEIPDEPTDEWVTNTTAALRASGNRQLAGMLRGAMRKHTPHAASAIGREAYIKAKTSVEKQKAKEARGYVTDERGQTVAKKFPIIPVAATVGGLLLVGLLAWATLGGGEQEAKPTQEELMREVVQGNETEEVIATEEVVAEPVGITGDGSVPASPDGTLAEQEQADLQQQGQEVYQQGYDAGIVDGKQIGEQSGYDTGYTDGQTSGFQSGQADGYNKGVAEGQEVGRQEGYAMGLQDGANKGKQEGYNTGLADGKSQGEEAGYNTGYTAGFKDGQAAVGGGATTPIVIAPQEGDVEVTAPPPTIVQPAPTPARLTVQNSGGSASSAEGGSPAPRSRSGRLSAVRSSEGGGGTSRTYTAGLKMNGSGSRSQGGSLGSLTMTRAGNSAEQPSERGNLSAQPPQSTATPSSAEMTVIAPTPTQENTAPQTSDSPNWQEGGTQPAAPTNGEGALVLNASSRQSVMTAQSTIGQGVSNTRFGPYRPYQRLQAQLTTAVVVGQGLPVLPVIAKSADGREWVGTPFAGPSNRVSITFTELVVANQNQVTPITAAAYDLYGVPGIQGRSKDLSPDLVKNLVRSSAMGARDYADAQLNASETIMRPDGTTVVVKSPPDLWTLVSARALDVLELPPNTQTFTRAVSLPVGTPFVIVVGASGGGGR